MKKAQKREDARELISLAFIMKKLLLKQVAVLLCCCCFYGFSIGHRNV